VNAKEGMRRLGLVLGIVGVAVSAALFSYPKLRDLEHNRIEHNEFERLRSSASVQQEITVIQNSYSHPGKYIYTTTKDRYGGLIIKHSTADKPAVPRLKITDHITGETAIVEWEGDKPPTNKEANHIIERQLDDQIKGYQVNVGDVRTLHFDNKGKVAGFTKRNGQTVYDQSAPSFSKYIAPFVFPFLCFLIPWGTVKTITWIGVGFFTSLKGDHANGKRER
jgi:hypothetical protein